MIIHMKMFNTILKVILGLIILMPILGVTGVLGEPTPELYNTREAYEFILALTTAAYIPYLNALVYALCLVLLLMKRTAFAALLMLPINVNVVAFHLFLDGGLFTAGALMGNILLLINIYLLWHCRDQYEDIWTRSAI